MKLTTKQQIRVDILSQYIDGRIFAEDAALAIGVKERQFRRLVKGFRERGVESVFHGGRGRRPLNSIPDMIKTAVIRLYRGRYWGLNLVHFREKLLENHPEIKRVPCYSTVRNVLIKECLLTPSKKKKSSIHRRRKRYEKEGMMVQIDGSHHRWFSREQPCCLTAAIDDATGKILSAKFTKRETTFASMDVVENILKNHGRFQMLYSDKAGIYGGGKRDGFSNMNRCMSELGIISIQANSPQAKGRVERLFKTLQSRLVSELRLKNITSLEAGNLYLEEYIKMFNARFAVQAVSNEPAYRELDQAINLDEVFYMKTDRIIQQGHVVSFNSDKYIITSDEYGPLIKKHVDIREYRNGDMKIFLCDGRELKFKQLESLPIAA